MSYYDYVVKPGVAAVAILPAFHDLKAKGALQLGLPVPKMTFFEKATCGFKAGPTTGLVIGLQLLLHKGIEKHFVKEQNVPTMFASAAVVGVVSAPVLAVFNGQGNDLAPRESLRRLTAKQGLALAVQETLFVTGIVAGGRFSEELKGNKLAEYGVAFASGAVGSLAGHPANTFVTREQNLMQTKFHQLMWGSLRKARAVGVFAVLYKLGTDTLNGK